VRILSGVVPPDAGVVEVAGRAVRFRSPAHARAGGLAPVFQDPAFAPDLTVAENLRLTATDPAAFRRRLDGLGLDGVHLGEPAGTLPLPLLRMLDLARVLAHDPALLLLDEITAALPADYAERVFEVIRRARDDGRSVLFISHRLLEVQEICDRVTVLRDGRNVDTLEIKGPEGSGERTERRIVAAMLGERAALAVSEPRRVAPRDTTRAGEPALQVRELVEQLLEPELVHLVDDDEEHLVVLVRARVLRPEDVVERQVGGVGEGGGSFGHGRHLAGVSWTGMAVGGVQARPSLPSTPGGLPDRGRCRVVAHGRRPSWRWRRMTL